MTRFAVLVSAPIRPQLGAEIAAGNAPRRDYLDIADELNAELINHPWRPKRGGMLAAGLVQAWHAFKRRDRWDVILSDSEHAGIPLALLLKLSRERKGHVMISHWLSPAKKVVFFRRLHVESHIDKLVTYSTVQEGVALNALGLARSKVLRVLHPADHHFWKPLGTPPEPDLLCSAGLEFRDYPTLLKAIDGLDVRLEIAAASPWSQRANLVEGAPEVPSNVTIGRRSYFELRELYDRSEFVVVPVFDVDFQAGSLVMYEAMAMRKAVIASRTRAHKYGDILRDGETGLLVPPGDSQALREAILELHRRPDLRERMANNARNIVVQGLNHEAYVTRMVEITREVASSRGFGVGSLEPGRRASIGSQ